MKWTALLITVAAFVNAGEKGKKPLNLGPQPPVPSAADGQSVRDLGVNASVCQAGNANYAIRDENDKARCQEAGGTVRPVSKNAQIEVKPFNVLTDSQERLKEAGRLHEQNRPEIQKNIHYKATGN